MRNWVGALSPDFTSTWRRFPLSILLLLGAAVVVILDSNDFVLLGAPRAQLLCTGFLAGAAFALGGSLFRESRPQLRVLGLILAYAIPVLVVVAHAIDQPRIIVAWPLLGVALLWTSVAAFTSGIDADQRREQQRRFWWLNYRAAMTAALGLVGLGAVVIGLYSIQRAIDTLLGFNVSWLLEHWIVPVAVLFLAPVYWLSTLPRLDAYRPEAVEKPDILAQALGFFGQFVLAPLLLVYGGILLAYTARIVAIQQLPQGTIGWMVIGFVVTGAVTWLILDAPFLQAGRLVRLFRRVWFWLTLIPIGLLAVAVWVRIDSYGLTPERVELIVAALWAVALALLILLRRGDIRLIPGLGAVLVLLLTFGPWSIENAPLRDQAGRFDAALSRATGTQPAIHWTSSDAEIARGAIDYLYANHGQDLLTAVIAAHGLAPVPTDQGVAVIFSRLAIDDAGTPVYNSLSRDDSVPVDLAATSTLIGSFDVWDSQDKTFDDLHLRLAGTSLALWRRGWTDRISVPLAAWAHAESHGSFRRPWLDFSFEGLRYRLLVDYGTIEDRPETPDLGRHFTYLRGLMFRSALLTPTP